MAEPGASRTSLAFGAFFIVAGLAFLLERLGLLELRGRYVLPVLLIVLGATLLLAGRGERRS